MPRCQRPGRSELPPGAQARGYVPKRIIISVAGDNTAGSFHRIAGHPVGVHAEEDSSEASDEERRGRVQDAPRESLPVPSISGPARADEVRCDPFARIINGHSFEKAGRSRCQVIPCPASRLLSAEKRPVQPGVRRAANPGTGQGEPD